MSLRDQWPWYLGGAIAAGFLGLLITRRDPLGAGGPGAVKPIGPPPDREPDPPAPPGAPLRWIELTEPSQYRLFNGDTYRACVDLPFGAGLLVTPARIVEEATKMGFVNVKASADIPPGWNGADDCDRFVEATWNLEDRAIARDSHIKHAWRRTRA